jgi:hypothetical protein
MIRSRNYGRCPALPPWRDACGFLALMLAECATLESHLMFAGFLYPAVGEHPEIHGVDD